MSRDSELFKDRRCTDDPCGHSLSSCSHCRALVWYAPRATGHLCGVCARDVREGRPLGTGQRERYLDYQDSVAEQHRSRIDRHRQDVYYDVVTSRSGHPRERCRCWSLRGRPAGGLRSRQGGEVMTFHNSPVGRQRLSRQVRISPAAKAAAERIGGAHVPVGVVVDWAIRHYMESEYPRLAPLYYPQDADDGR